MAELSGEVSCFTGSDAHCSVSVGWWW